MKKTFLMPILAILTGGALAGGCALASNSSTQTVIDDTSLAKEIATSSLFVASSKAVSSLKKAAVPNRVFEGAPIEVDVDDIPATLSNFDELSIANYSIATVSEASDRDDYANKTQLTYTLPSGESNFVVLYFGAITTETEESDASTTSELTDSDITGALKNALHGHGYGGGSCDGMLKGSNRFINILKHGNADLTYQRNFGIAVIGTDEYPFAAEHVEAVTASKTYEASSFALLFSENSFLSVEQAYVTDGTNLNEVYIYTLVNGDDSLHYLIQDSSTKMRMAYLTGTQKIAINRFTSEDKTYYTIHVREKGVMNLFGVYERIITTDEAGNETITYELIGAQDEAGLSLPSED